VRRDDHEAFRAARLDGEVEFRRVAINQEQVVKFDLPTRPPKRDWDGGNCVEIDTLSSAQIRELLEGEIIALIDPGEWRRLEAIEAAERETLNKILAQHRDELGGEP
jgi:hypothetical protein